MPEETKADWFWDHTNNVYVAKCSQSTLIGRCHAILSNINEIEIGDCGAVHIAAEFAESYEIYDT